MSSPDELLSYKTLSFPKYDSPTVFGDFCDDNVCTDSTSSRKFVTGNGFNSTTTIYSKTRTF